MKQLLFILFSISFYGIANCQQLKTYDIVNISKNKEGRAKVTYFTALWCKPCMSKLKPLMDTFSKKKDIDFMVLFDRYGMTDETINKLSRNFDTAYFGLLPEKYYPANNSNGLVTLKLNSPKKTINALAADYNNVHHTNLTTDDIWVGVAFLQKGTSFYITKESELNKLVDEINSFLKSTE